VRKSWVLELVAHGFLSSRAVANHHTHVPDRHREALLLRGIEIEHGRLQPAAAHIPSSNRKAKTWDRGAAIPQSAGSIVKPTTHCTSQEAALAAGGGGTEELA